MASSKNENEKQKKGSNREGSGTEYHKEHAGNVEGYGEPHMESVSNKAKKDNK